MQAALVSAAQPVENPVEERRKALRVRRRRLQQQRAHHRRQGQRDDARDDDRAGESEGEFAKQRARQSGDEADRRVDAGERDRHRNHRAGDFARALQRRVLRRHAFLDVPVDVFDDDDGVVDDEADGEHEGEKRQKIDRIAERQQNDHDADERQRDGDDRDDRRAEAAEEQENHQDDDDRGFGQRLLDLVDRGADELRRVIGDRGVEADGKLGFQLGKRRPARG